jgi:hypothetical protein
MVFPPMRIAEETDRSDEFLFKSVTSAFERSRYLVAQFVGGTQNKDLYIYDTSGTRVLHRTARDFTGSLIFLTFASAIFPLHAILQANRCANRFRAY